MVAIMAAILNLGLHSHGLFFKVRNEVLAPKYPTLDTEIIILCGIVTEIWDASILAAILAAILNFAHEGAL